MRTDSDKLATAARTLDRIQAMFRANPPSEGEPETCDLRDDVDVALAEIDGDVDYGVPSEARFERMRLGFTLSSSGDLPTIANVVDSFASRTDGRHVIMVQDEVDAGSYEDEGRTVRQVTYSLDMVRDQVPLDVDQFLEGLGYLVDDDDDWWAGRVEDDRETLTPAQVWRLAHELRFDPGTFGMHEVTISPVPPDET